MNKTIFNQGKQQTITDVLAAKDHRLEIQQAFFAKYPEKILVNMNLNIPGPIKNNRYLQQIFAWGVKQLEDLFKQNNFSFHLVKTINADSGQEVFYLLDNDPYLVKKVCIAFEDQTKLGRLFDADVLICNQKKAISRSVLKVPSRSCFICSRPAKECARSRRHSVSQMQAFISKLYFENLA